MLESNQKNKDSRAELLRYATNILGRRPYFYGQLKNKLQERAQKLNLENYEDEITSILENLQKSGYLNDSYLAIGFIKRCLNRGQGPKIIRFKLLSLGLNTAQISEALNAPECQQALVESKAKLASKYAGQDEYKLKHRLYQRGF